MAPPLPDGLVTQAFQGPDDKVDSDVSPTNGQIWNIDLTVDRLYESMGAYTRGTMGGHVFCDANSSQSYDGDEGIKDALLSFYDDTDCDGTGDGLDATASTGPDGAYGSDAGVVGPPGEPVCFTVHVDQSTVGTCNNPITPTGWAAELDANEPTNLDADFGFRRDLKLDKRIYLPLAVHKNR
jgi:hypothetical protein